MLLGDNEGKMGIGDMFAIGYGVQKHNCVLAKEELASKYLLPVKLSSLALTKLASWTDVKIKWLISIKPRRVLGVV